MIKVESIHDKFATTYIVSNGQDLLIIDPAIEVRSIEQMITRYFNGQNVVGIMLTHGHYDHFKNLKEVYLKYKVPVYITKNDSTKINDIVLSCANLFGILKLDNCDYQFKYLQEGYIEIGSFRIKVLLTPGHTNGSVCLIIDDVMFSGDTLFLDGVGRTDLPTGNSIMLNKSIIKLMNIEKNYQVFPGHGEPTTIELERKYNYYYQRIKN